LVFRAQEGSTLIGPTRRFDKTLEAVNRADTTQGAIGDALRADMTADTEGPHARRVSQFEDCEAFLSENGHEFDAKYLRALYQAAAPTTRERYPRG
jgi:hypothetical protein